MKRSYSRQILALVLGLMLAVGTVVSAVQASDMAFDPATSSCVDSMGSICCDDCDKADGNIDASACQLVCMAGACAVMPSRITLKTADQERGPVPTHLASLDRSSSPEPNPPRPIDFV